MSYKPEAEYIDTVVQAKLIRAQLKKHFPETKFSVKSDRYAGGSSIRVRWTNGPTQPEVDAITDPFAGGGFDGMIDMAYSVQTWLLPDGSAQYGKSSGTEGSRGSDSGYDNPPPVAGAKLVRFSAHYIFTNRDYTAGALQAIGDEVKEKFGTDIPDIVPDGYYGAYWKNSDHNFDRQFHQVAKEFSL